MSRTKITVRQDPNRLRGAEISKAVGNAAKADNFWAGRQTSRWKRRLRLFLMLRAKNMPRRQDFARRRSSEPCTKR